MNDNTLRLVLRLNAANSAICGAALIVFGGPLADVLGVDRPGWVRLVGAGLLPFAAALVWVAAGDAERLRRFVPGIVVGDIGWVLASVVTLVAGWYSGVGIALVIAMAVLVDGFAMLQWRGVRAIG